MNKNGIKLIAAGAILLLMLSCLFGCDAKSKEVESLLAEFEQACNTLDINAMLDCITPTVADPIKVGVSLYDLFVQQSDDKTLDQIAVVLSGDSKLDGNDFFSSVKIEVRSVKADGENMLAETDLSYTLLGQTYEKDAIFTCTMNSDKWYISGFKFN